MKKILTIELLLFSLFSGWAFAQENPPLSFKEPLLITTAGQGAEVQLASVLAKRAGLDYVLLKAATSRDLENVKTLVLVLGVSLKGLGAAGLDMAKERGRVSQLVEEAQRKNIPLLCLHLGGEARRGQLSDEIISAFLPYAQMAIVVRAGNKDGLFTKICHQRNIRLVEVEKTADVLTPFKGAFNK